MSADWNLDVAWYARSEASNAPSAIPQIISNRVFVEAMPDHVGHEFGLLVSMIFADGIASVAEVTGGYH